MDSRASLGTTARAQTLSAAFCRQRSPRPTCQVSVPTGRPKGTTSGIFRRPGPVLPCDLATKAAGLQKAWPLGRKKALEGPGQSFRCPPRPAVRSAAQYSSAHHYNLLQHSWAPACTLPRCLSFVADRVEPAA